MKKLVIICMAAMLLCLLAVPVMAASDEANLSANALYELGLFAGTGTDENGDPIFDLDRTPTRSEAVVMLVRLLGKEEEAKAGTWETPFTDVPGWAAPYVGYAYENGLTRGTGDTTFGGSDEISVSQYLTFVLRALGYESGVDFQWNKAWEMTDQLGITNGQYDKNSEFTRGDVATISSNSLAVPDKGEDAVSIGLAYEINEDDVTCTITGMGTCTDMRVVIPETINGFFVTAIGANAFAECTSVAFIQIPESVFSIGDRAFYGCTGMTQLTIPATVFEIGSEVIYRASNLHTVYYHSQFSTHDYPVLKSDTLTKVVFGGEYVPWDFLRDFASIKEVVILDGVTEIKGSAFSGCINLTSIVIPNSVTSIGRDAFRDCSSLTSIVIPDGVTTIEIQTFYDCAGLTSVHIPDGVTSLGMNAFYGCSSLTNVVLPDSVTSIGNGAFSGCSNLTSVNIPNGIESLPLTLFQNCSSLASIEIPDSVTSIENNAFWGCESLTSIQIPDNVTSIGAHAFQHCYGLTDIVIPDGVTSLEKWAFRGNRDMTSVVLPDSLASIGESVFHDCRNLTSFHFNGTKEQWTAIEKGESWDANTGSYTVYCTDGSITK